MSDVEKRCEEYLRQCGYGEGVRPRMRLEGCLREIASNLHGRPGGWGESLNVCASDLDSPGVYSPIDYMLGEAEKEALRILRQAQDTLWFIGEARRVIGPAEVE